jgi:PST family polysaccharide transporter
LNATPISARRVAASSAVLLVESVLRLGLTALVSFWIARALGPAQFGILNFASALMVIFLAFGSLGMEVPVVLRLAQGQRPGAVLATVLALRLAASLLACAAAVAAALLLKHDDPQALAVTLVVALAILGYAPSVFDLWFKARVQAAAPAVMRLATTLLASAAKLACLALDGGVVALAWTVVLEAVLGSLLLWLAWRHATAASPAHGPMRPEAGLARELVRDSSPYLGSNLAGLVAARIDVVLLGYLASHAQTGVYSVVQKLSEVACVVPIVLVDSAYPALARRLSGAGPGDAAQGQLLFDLAAAAALLAALAGACLAGPLIGAVFGDAYAAAVPLLHWHVWTCVAVALGAARHRWLATQGLQRYAPAVTLAGAVISVALNLAMIPRWGAAGAVAAALITQFTSGWLTSFLIRDLRAIGAMQARALWPWARLWQAWMARPRSGLRPLASQGNAEPPQG